MKRSCGLLLATIALCSFLTSSCFGKKTCASGDLDCYLESLQFTSSGGTVTNPVLVSTLAVSAAYSSADGGTAAPQITNQPGAMQYTGSSTSSVELDWNDPQGAQPAFCWKFCNPRFQCTARSACTPSIRDGRISGVWRSFLGFKTEPAETTTSDQFDAHVTPISASGGQDPLASIQSGSSGSSGGSGSAALGGPEVTIPQTVTGGGGSGGGGGGGGGGGCGTDCSGFGSRHCSGSQNAVYADGLCHCCQVLCPGGTNCRCILCSEVNCSGDSMCAAGNKCVFKVGGTACQ